MEKARADADRQAKGDAGLSEREKVGGRLRTLLDSTRRTFELLRAKLTEVEKRRAGAALDRAERALSGSLDEVRSALNELEVVAEELGQAMLRG